MKANPGGQLASEDVIGRDELIEGLWRVLQRQSLVLSAERRMGKTCIVKKMQEEAVEELLAVYRDLEGIRKPLEFVEVVLKDVEALLSTSQKTAAKARRLVKKLVGVEVGGVIKLPEQVGEHWKELLFNTMEDLMEQEQRQVVFFWDELPLMLFNIRQRSDEKTAMELLDVLRSLRQTHARLRMVFTGSIGLHNVISFLKREGYANDPTNDMDTRDVPPLPPIQAQSLARQLLEGEDIHTENLDQTARAIAEAVDGVPYFIHHVVDEMAASKETANEELVEQIVTSCLTDPQDRWHLRYYHERLHVYYVSEEQAMALGLLDVLAVSDAPLPFEDLFQQLKARQPTEAREPALAVVALLLKDHYLDRTKEGALHFRFPLIQRFWRLHRGL